MSFRVLNTLRVKRFDNDVLPCHSERSEESENINLRFTDSSLHYVPFRMTRMEDSSLVGAQRRRISKTSTLCYRDFLDKSSTTRLHYTSFRSE